MAFIAQYKHSFKRGACVAITVVEAAVIAAIFALNYFAHNTAGANHYVYYYKLEYSRGLLSAPHLRIFALGALLIAIVCIFRLILRARKASLSMFWAILSGVLLVASAAFLMVCAFSALFADVLVWAYLIFVAAFILVLAALQSFCA